MASWNAIFHRSARGSRALVVGTIAALAGAAMLAPGGCTLDLNGASVGGSSATSTTTTTTDATTSTGVSATASSGSCGTGAGCMPCVSQVDCGMATQDGCTASTCVDSFCKPKDTAGLLSITQTPHDCMKSVCGADGKPALQPDPNDTPIDDLNVCTQELCVAGVPTKMPAALGTLCPNGTCDGAGACVNCTKNGDCTTGTNPTCDMALHTCISCSDGLDNGTETGIDCGGNCGKCTGDTCGKNTDCAGSMCVDKVCCTTACGGTCEACNVPGSLGTCTPVPVGDMDPGTCMDPALACDGAQNCKASTGKACTLNSDCASSTCLAGFCRAPNGKPCVDNAECASKLCTSNSCAACAGDVDCPSKSCVAGVCKAPNGSPCDVNGDCVGGKCQGDLCKLDNTDPCVVGLDCLSGYCTAGACQSCISNANCPASSSCGAVTGMALNACRLPTNAYCETPLPVGLNCNSGMCKGFPAACK